MGVGTPLDILEAVKSGIDLFDCVIPTRNARNGFLYTSSGIVKIRNSKYAIDINPVDESCEVIGPGGKMIREIVEETGAKIDIEDDGSVSVAAVSQTSSDAALARIREIVAEPELGEIYTGKVVKTVDFGAFVNFLGARDGLVHISEMKNERVAQTTDVCKEGDMVKVKVIGFDDRGKVKLSMKRVDQETGADLETE